MPQSIETAIALMAAVQPSGWRPTRAIAEDVPRIAKRSVERALRELEKSGYIESRKATGRTVEWRWLGKRAALRERITSAEKALTLTLIASHAKALLPLHLSEALTHSARAERHAMVGAAAAQHAFWETRVIATSSALQRYPKADDPELLRVIYYAMWHRRTFRVDYRAVGKPVRRWQVHPQALVLVDACLYVVALLNEKHEPVHLNVRRMTDAELEFQTCREADAFSLDAQVRRFQWHQGKPKRLQIRVHQDVIHEFSEAPIAPDQIISGCPNRLGYFTLQATIARSHALQVLLNSYGDQVRY